jgi:hypothetical protein
MAYMSPKLQGQSPEVFQLETSDTSGYAVDWHAHDCHMLLLPRQGGLFLSTESSQPAFISRQSFSLVPVDFAHATEAAPGRETHMTLYVDPAYVKRQGQMHGYRDFDNRAHRSGIWQASDTLESILRLHDQLQACTSQEAFQRQLPHLNHLLFEECARVIACQQAQPQPGMAQQQALLVGDIQRYVRERLEGDLSIESIASRVSSRRRQTKPWWILPTAYASRPLRGYCAPRRFQCLR